MPQEIADEMLQIMNNPIYDSDRLKEQLFEAISQDPPDLETYKHHILKRFLDKQITHQFHHMIQQMIEDTPMRNCEASETQDVYVIHPDGTMDKHVPGMDPDNIIVFHRDDLVINMEKPKIQYKPLGSLSDEQEAAIKKINDIALNSPTHPSHNSHWGERTVTSTSHHYDQWWGHMSYQGRPVTLEWKGYDSDLSENNARYGTSKFAPQATDTVDTAFTICQDISKQIEEMSCAELSYWLQEYIHSGDDFCNILFDSNIIQANDLRAEFEKRTTEQREVSQQPQQSQTSQQSQQSQASQQSQVYTDTQEGLATDVQESLVQAIQKYVDVACDGISSQTCDPDSLLAYERAKEQALSLISELGTTLVVNEEPYDENTSECDSQQTERDPRQTAVNNIIQHALNKFPSIPADIKQNAQNKILTTLGYGTQTPEVSINISDTMH